MFNFFGRSLQKSIVCARLCICENVDTNERPRSDINVNHIQSEYDPSEFFRESLRYGIINLEYVISLNTHGF